MEEEERGGGERAMKDGRREKAKEIHGTRKGKQEELVYDGGKGRRIDRTERSKEWWMTVKGEKGRERKGNKGTGESGD